MNIPHLFWNSIVVAAVSEILGQRDFQLSVDEELTPNHSQPTASSTTGDDDKPF